MSNKSRRSAARRRHQLADAKANPPAETPLGIIGFGGSMFPWEWLWATPHEYNPDLMGRRAQDVYMRMLNDSQIAGIADLLTLPIRQVRWRTIPGGDTTLDQQICDFAEQSIFEAMATTWDDVLSQMGRSELNGYSIHEIEWVQRDGQVCLGGLWDLLPSTIEKVLYRPDRRLDGVWQWGTDTNGNSRRETIEAARLLFTISGGRGGSAAGEAKLRAIYQEWFILHPLLRLLTVGLENSLIGTVWAKVPRSMTVPDRQLLRQSIENLRVRDATGFVLDADVILDILEGKRNAMDALPFVDSLRTQMSKRFQQQFVQLGTQSGGGVGGGRSVSEDHSRLFLMGRNASADAIEGNLNRNLIRRLVDYNWPGYGVYPQLRHDDILRIYNLASLGDSLSKLSQGDLLHWDEELENALRDTYNFDPLPEGFLPPNKVAAVPSPAAPAAVPAETAAETDAGDPQAEDDPADEEQPLQQTAPDACTCDRHQLSDPVSPQGPLFDQLGDSFQVLAGGIVGGMIRHLEDACRKALHDRPADDPLSQAYAYRALAGLTLPGREEFRAALRMWFEETTGAARNAAADVQGYPASDLSVGLKQWLDAQVDALARRIPDRLHADFLQSILNGSTAVIPDAQLVSDASQTARDGVGVEFRQSFLDAEADLRVLLAGYVSPSSGAVDPADKGADMT